MLKEVHQEGETSLRMTEEHKRSFYVVRVKYIYLSNIKSVLFTKLEPQRSQKQMK